jgi:hypothetical protein
MRIMASVHPSTMTPLAGTCVVGDAVERYRDVLTAAGDLFESDDIANDDRLCEIPASIVGDDTRATLTIPLRDDEDHVVGFVRMDGREADFITPRALEDLLAIVDPALLAAHLEPEITQSRRDARENTRLLQWMGDHIGRQRDAIETLRTGVLAAAQKLEALGRTLDPSTHRTLRTLCESVKDTLETANASLEAHLDDAPSRQLARAARVPISSRPSPVGGDTPKACGPSIDETRG